jgi:formiminotetrahydrofolate cyclodeaminase
MVACMGTALLRKAFAVSLQKERRVADRRHALEAVLEQLHAKDLTIREGVEQDATAFDSYACALGLPHGDWSETRIREKAREEALVHAISTSITLASEVHGCFRFALDHLPSIHDAVLSDAIAGLQLMISATECLLLTAESNLAKVSNPVFQSTMSRRIREMRHLTAQAESQLACRLRSRQLTRSS